MITTSPIPRGLNGPAARPAIDLVKLPRRKSGQRDLMGRSLGVQRPGNMLPWSELSDPPRGKIVRRR